MNEQQQLEQTIIALEAQRAILGDAVVSIAVAPLREKLATLKARAVPEEQQRKQVTVLFADISGFTAMSEMMDAEEVTTLVNALWTRIDGAITSHGGRIDKHIGDAVMALFGAPTAHEDDPERAIRSALDMLAALRTFAQTHADDADLQMRIGINTGPVLLGAIGTTGEYTAMGDTVNLASRLEHHAPVGGILVSHDTYRHVRGIFDVIAQEPLAVKGKVEPIRTYVVRATKPLAFRAPTRGVEGIETRTIGRAAELHRLQEAFIAARDERQTHVVTVLAEAGVGKSRLLAEFLNWLELLPNRTRQFSARATPETSRMPYALIRSMFATHFDIQDSDRAALAREKLELGILGLMGAGHEEEAHFIGHLCGFDFSDSPYLKGILADARQIHDRAFHYVAEFFAAITRESSAEPANDRVPQSVARDDGQPVALMLEDTHWADEGSLDLIDYLVKDRPKLPLMVLSASRPTLRESRPSWGNGAPINLRVELNPLSEHESRELVHEILFRIPKIPAELQNLIVSRAEGSPFYVEELIKMFIEDGIIVTSENEWHVVSERLRNVRVPATLTGILQARLDGLPPHERETLQQASVVGRVFWTRVLEQLHRASAAHAARTSDSGSLSDSALPAFPADSVMAGASVEVELEGLAQRELIFQRDESSFASTHEFIFKHGILHEVTYESVLKRLRRAYHAQVAVSLHELSGERVNEHAGRISHHYEQAGDHANAAHWYARAGEQAQNTYALDAAVNYFQKALSLWSMQTENAAAVERFETYQGLGFTFVAQARYGEALETFERMRADAEVLGDMRAQSRAWYGIAHTRSVQGNHRAALVDAAHAESTARAIDARDELMTAMEIKGRCLFRLGDSDAALLLGEEALALARTLGAQRRAARCLNLIGAIHNSLGRYPQAQQSFEEARAIGESLGDRSSATTITNNLGVIAEALGDYQGAFDYYQSALNVARAIGFRDGEMAFLGNVGAAQVGMGEYYEAELNLRQVIEVATATGHGGLENTYRWLAEACLHQGKVDEALSAAQRAMELAQQRGVPSYLGAAWRVFGMVAAELSEPVRLASDAEADLRIYDARECFAESMRIYTETHMEGERARTLREWGGYEIECGNAEFGAELMQEARETFARIGAVAELARVANRANT